MLLIDYWNAFRRRWYVMLVVMVLCAATALGLSLATKPQYSSTASVYFSITFGQDAADLSQGANFTQSQVASYAALAKTPIVLDRVIKELDLNTSISDLVKQIDATSSTQTVLVEITAQDPDANQSAQLANAVAEQLGLAVRELAPQDADGNPTVKATTVSPGTVPTGPSSPQTKRNLLAGGLGGAVLGFLAVLLTASLDRGAAVGVARRKVESSESDDAVPTGVD